MNEKNYMAVFILGFILTIVLTINSIFVDGEKFENNAAYTEYNASQKYGSRENTDTDEAELKDSEVRLKNSKGYHDLCRIISATYGYIEEGAFAADTGPRLHNLINAGETDELPIIEWDEGTSLDVPKELDVLSIECIKANGERVLELYANAVKRNGVETKENGLENYKEYLSELPKGVYYVAVEVYRVGKYIETEDEYEHSLEQYVFCLDFSRD